MIKLKYLKESNDYDKLMSELFYLYGSIPLEKEKSSEVINKIILSEFGKSYKLGDDIHIDKLSNHNLIRFIDYFDSLISSKDIRGHCYEGTLAGLYGGKLSKRGNKWDMLLNGEKWSIKFSDFPNKAIEIGRYGRKIKKSDSDLYEEIIKIGGLNSLFKWNKDNSKDELKERTIEIMFTGEYTKGGGWIISYLDNSSDSKTDVICQYILRYEDIKYLLMNGFTTGPKQGESKQPFSLSLSSTYKYLNYKPAKIFIPTKSKKEDLLSDYGFDDLVEWAEKILKEVKKHKN